MEVIEDQIKNSYFEWLYNYVCKGRVNRYVLYKKLFTLLHNTEFIFPLQNDIERAKDGVDLRCRYAMEKDYVFILDILEGPCSVLEMMVALAIRCEETIMDDARYGDRTGQWFWNMLSNIGISYMTDDKFDRKIAEDAINDFLERRYDPDGKGGLFYIENCEEDLRDIEIWSQLCWYLEYFA